MIHVRTSFPSTPDGDPSIHISIVGVAEMHRLQHILNSALNCKPEFGAEWFELTDKLTSFMTAASLERAKHLPVVGDSGEPTGQT